MITTIVFVTNGESIELITGEFLCRVTLDEGLVKALQKDYRTAPITEPERVMLDYMVKLTRDATRSRKRTTNDCGPRDSTIKAFCKLR